MNQIKYMLAALMGISLFAGVCAQEFGAIGGDLRSALQDSRSGADNSGIQPAMLKTQTYTKSAHAQAPKDDLKGPVIKHLDKMLEYCDKRMDDCNGKDGSIRAFAKTIGNGRCNNRGYNCVNGVLEMCKGQLEDDDVTPMYYMACGAMLGKLGERDCAEGRASCGGDLQGAVYFSLRAAAACHKSYEKDPEELELADKNIERFSKVVKSNIKDIYVGEVEEGESIGTHLAWFGVHKVGMITGEKVLEFTFERLAMHTAAGVVGSASIPLFAFTGAMLFHEIAASEMNKLVCTEWDGYYNGKYSNVSRSITSMTGHIK